MSDDVMYIYVIYHFGFFPKINYHHYGLYNFIKIKKIQLTFPILWKQYKFHINENDYDLTEIIIDDISYFNDILKKDKYYVLNLFNEESQYYNRLCKLMNVDKIKNITDFLLILYEKKYIYQYWNAKLIEQHLNDLNARLQYTIDEDHIKLRIVKLLASGDKWFNFNK